ncbi:hypothetical protein CAP35_14410 [Chitinophagaceae bacterium IBVUCB1]|nr:hypothetical protein CAP35_14410 [Chitinophagaceae bacterium IBVUCB1]
MKTLTIVMSVISLTFVYGCSQSITGTVSDGSKQAAPVTSSAGSVGNTQNNTSAVQQGNNTQQVQLNTPVNKEKVSTLSE